MKKNEKRVTTRCTEGYAIKDSNGRYVDKYSIWYNNEDKTWNYETKGGIPFDASMKNRDTGIILNHGIDGANQTIEKLKSLLHNVGLMGMEFSIERYW